MAKMDGTVKFLLTAIVILLGILVLKPLVKVATPALAQTTSSKSSQNTSDQTASSSEGSLTAYRLQEVGTMVPTTGKTIREIQVIDSAQAFLVRYDDQVEVFRVQSVTINPEAIKTLQNNTNLPFPRP
ncbi:MAG: hypothetical protein M1457_14460 [bacterium]|nr:hypothetical protein [bacterium]